MKKIHLIGEYFFRIIKSAPVIGAGLLDAILLIINSLGIEYQIPVWFYGLFLGIGFLTENIRIYLDYRNIQGESKLIVGIYYDNQTKWGDSISFKYPKDQGFRPSIGFVIATKEQGSVVKGVSAKFTFSWQGETPSKTFNLYPPKNDARWKIIYDHITYSRPASFSFDGSKEVVTHDQPLYLPNFEFHAVETLDGYILINYEVTGIDHSRSTNGELIINLSKS